jgi:nitrate/nitrite transport system substrate-binding protein
VLGVPEYVNATASSIEGRLAGNYQLGAGLGSKTFKDDYMVFYRGGDVNFPRRAHAIWFLAEYQRLGMLSTTPDYKKLADEILLQDVYKKVAPPEDHGARRRHEAVRRGSTTRRSTRSRSWR